MLPALHWPELIAQLESVDNIPVHLCVRGALRPLTDVRRCGERVCAQAGSYELSALTTDAAATLWRAIEQMAIGNHTDDAFALVDDLVAPITGMWLLNSDLPATGRIVAFTCAPAWLKAAVPA
jgi:hypothetical protein